MKYTPWFVAVALGLACISASAQNAPQRSLCATHEEAVFSCKLQGSRKTVSLCAAPSSTADAKSWNFHYLFGRPVKIELKYPPRGPHEGAFTYTHLVYAGDTGGYAHTFTNEGYKYILYKVSGQNVERSGVLIQREGQTLATRDMKCQSSTVIETSNESLSRITSSWKADPDIDAHGLPSTR